MLKRIITSGFVIILFLVSCRIKAQVNLQSLINQIKPIQKRTINSPANYAGPLAISSYSPHLAQLFELEQKCKSFYPHVNKDYSHKKISSYPDTLIVGVSPYDTLTLTGTITHNGPIYVALNGVLIIKKATLTNLGDLDVFNHGKVIIDSSTISFPQSYFYQRSLILVNKANVSISHTKLSYGGLSHSCVVADTASLTLTNVNQTDWTTTGMNNMATININGTTQAGEFILMDYITLHIKNATNALLWHQFPDTSVINWSFGKHDTAYGYQFNKSKTGVKGIEYTITADSVYDIMWGMMPCSNSNITISNSKIRSIGLWFNNDDSTIVSGITDNATYSNFTAPLSDRTLILNNCTVQTWSFYDFYKTIINVSGCIVGEIGTENSSKMYGNDYLVDGSGGYHWSSDTSTIVANNATVYSDVRSEKNSFFVFAYGAVTNSGIAAAIDKSLLIVVQSTIPASPSVFSGSAAWFDNINDPGNIFADSIAPISGSALINRGPSSKWMYFKNRQLFYQSIDSANWIPASPVDTVPVYNAFLTNWNTHGLASGSYYLDLRITDTWGNKVDAIKQVTVLPLILGIQHVSALSNISIYPNPAAEDINISLTSSKQENATIELDNLLGQNLLSESYTIAIGNNSIHINTSALSEGTYICRIISGKSTMQKLVVISGK